MSFDSLDMDEVAQLLMRGPPPVPSQEQALVYKAQSQKTLRDEFAMAALTGLLNNESRAKWSQDDFVSEAWSLADAMMKAREG